MMDQTYTDTAHLLRRAGFGADPETVKAAAAAGLAATTDSLLHPERTPDTLNDTAFIDSLAALLPEPKNGGLPMQAVADVVGAPDGRLSAPAGRADDPVLAWALYV